MNRKIPLISATAVVIFLFLSMVPAAGQSAQSTTSITAPGQWSGAMGDYPLNYGWNPQTQVGVNNVNSLGIKWIFPIPAAPANEFPLVGNGVIITPLIEQGIAYFITDFHAVYAVNTQDGSVIWTRTLPVSFGGVVANYAGGANSSGHYHAIWYTSSLRGRPLIWIDSDNFTVYALDALTGDVNLAFSYLNANSQIPGNFGLYDSTSHTLVIDPKSGILVAGTSGSESITSGRGFFEGFNVSTTPPTLLWRQFIMPPQDGSNPNWDIQSVNNMTHAYIFNGTGALDLKSLSPSLLNSTLYGDWGNMGYNGTRSEAGTNPAWGGTWAVDPNTGTAYVASAQPAPDQNASSRPGPNLWSDSIFSINEATGKFNWVFQTTSHDLVDWDCSWGVILGNATVNGQSQEAVYKACKNGYLYALNAQTGEPIWVFNPPNIKRCSQCYIPDPLNKTRMDQPWIYYGTPNASDPLLNCANTGCIESNPAYDPSTNSIFVIAHNNPTYVPNSDLLGYNGGHHGPTKQGPPNNMTLFAIDASTGSVKWSHYFANMAFRGGVAVSGGIVYVPAPDGNLYYFNEQNGNLVGQKFLFGGLATEPAIAQDASGNFLLVEPSSAYPTSYLVGGGGTVPGFIVGLSLPTSNSTASPSSTATVSTGGSNALATATSTVTVTAPASSATQTATNGIAPSEFYAAVAVAIVFIAATGVLAATRRSRRSG